MIPSEVSYSSSMDGGSPMTNVEMIWVRFETGDQQGAGTDGDIYLENRWT